MPFHVISQLTGAFPFLSPFPLKRVLRATNNPFFIFVRNLCEVIRLEIFFRGF
jgi:hypothetical protein